MRIRRGDGIGVEYTRSAVRGVRLDHRRPERLDAVAEVPILTPDDDRAIVDAFVRLRGELGSYEVPTRIGMFPTGTRLQRIDATGLNGPELNRRRTEIDRDHGESSTVLVDAGPRRWLYAIGWDASSVRRIEELAERSGFTDLSIDPSPLAIARVAAPDITWIRRDAAIHEAFRLILCDGWPVAASTVDTTGHTAPDLQLAATSFSVGVFDDHFDGDELAAAVQRIAETVDRSGELDSDGIRLGQDAYPTYPAYDIRSAERQCVALGAAVGAAGLAGRLRPVDMVLPRPVADDGEERPWAIERMTDLPPAPRAVTVGPVKRVLARVLPRRR